MKNIGLKNLLILSVVFLVGLSVSFSNYMLFLQDKKVLSEHIIKESKEFVSSQGEIIETLINEKVIGLSNFVAPYKDKTFLGSSEEIIELTHTLARTLNTGSAMVMFDDGVGYWNQVTPIWPNHVYFSDVRERSWYKEAYQASGVTVSKPYKEIVDPVYWITVIEKIKNGAISIDFRLDFLNTLVQQVNKQKGTFAVIFDSDTTILATSSPAVELGKKAISYKWFEDVAKKTLGQDNAMQNYTLDGEEKIYFAHRLYIGDKQWYLGISVKKSTITDKLEQTVNMAIMTVIISAIVSMLLAFVILQFLYRPIYALKETILGLSSGDGSVNKRLSVSTDDDLGQIAQGVNLFIDKIQNLLTQKKEPSFQLLANDEVEINELSAIFKQRWKDVFEHYKVRVHKEDEFREELKLDVLTGLPTRSYFEILLSDAIKNVYSKKEELLLVAVNLDNYEEVVEGMTHEQVQKVTRELSNFIETLLPAGAILSHTSQSKFSILLKNTLKIGNLEVFIHQLTAKLRENELKRKAFDYKLGASVLSYTDDKPTVSGLFYQVNNALYSIANNTDATYAFYDKKYDMEKEERRSLILDFKKALKNKNNELELYFQPQIDIKTKNIIGAEALVRWHHPQRGFLTPDKFVHLLDDDVQLDIKFGEWLVESALELLTARADNYTISVNITPTHLQRSDFFEHIKLILDAYPRSVSQRLKIELTETVSISNHTRVETSMRKCRELGVHFSLDDFGTGYSTLNQLRTFPASELKIDRSFIQHLEKSEEDRKMVSAMIMLAKRFGIGVVAEGVENSAQERLLAKFGTMVVQGYYYSKPLTYAEFNQWVKDYNF